jgi:pyruvate kinase
MLFNRTKIIATIGPASSSEKILEELMIAGVDVFRLNSSHGTYAEFSSVISNIRKLSVKHTHNAAVLVDLQGPKIRVGDIESGSLELDIGESIIFTTDDCPGTKEKIHINYDRFPHDVKAGENILIDDGKIQLTVVETNSENMVKAVVVNGGTLLPRKGVNLPHTKISLPSLTEKDLEDLTFALEQNADWIGLSFVRTANDIHHLKDIIARKGNFTKVIAKIEKPEALNDIDNIIREADGVMVARGDLGVEMPMEEVPLIQKMLVQKCLQASRPVIIATQMMESMITNYSPTRAEVNDVANSVIDGADAVMLSGETSIGKFPVKAVEYMQNIIATVEKKNYGYNRLHQPDPDSSTYISDSVCFTACVVASQVGAKVIAGMTRSGYTAFRVSSQRPAASVIIFTDNLPLLTVLSLVWGVRGFYYDRYVSTDETIADIQKILKEKKILLENDILVNIASIPLSERGTANMVKLSRVK